MTTVRKTVETSASLILVCVILTMLNVYGYMYVPEWIIWLILGAVALFWGTALLLAFLVWVICFILRMVLEEKIPLQKHRNKCTEDD